jgi:hypothetical protein
MKWVTTDYKGNKKVWYSEDEVQRYINLLIEIKKLKEANGIKDDVLKMIDRFLEVG